MPEVSYHTSSQRKQVDYCAFIHSLARRAGIQFPSECQRLLLTIKKVGISKALTPTF